MERTTIQTNSGTDSSGKAFGIEAKHFVPVLYALLGSLVFYFVISMMPGMKGIPLWIQVIAGFTPFILALIYIVALVVGKPPHYQQDYLEARFVGADFNAKQQAKPQHPLKALKS